MTDDEMRAICSECGESHDDGACWDEEDQEIDAPDRSDLSQLSLRADLFERQARLCQADMQVIRMALNENRPLEALYTVNEALDRLDEELETVEEVAPSGGDSQ